tara:strand:+ start:1623 stop:2069 length:447 start_codon:yes stop_codon:yes gene_type:complete
LKNAFIGIGSNLDGPITHVRVAIEDIKSHNKIKLLKSSSLYKSKPVGPQDQDDFVNAVVKIATTLSPLQLLDELQKIEYLHHRKRLKKWGPRSLDLDILMFENTVMRTKKLTLPHPEIIRRDFVIVPLLEITHKNLVITKNKKLRDYL